VLEGAMNKEYIKKIDFFSEIDNESLAKVEEILIERKYKKNMVIFMSGEPAEAVYIVRRGKVKISKVTQDGKEHIIHIMSDGDVFAEACLFGIQPYPANAEAIEDSDICMIKNKDLEELLVSQPKMAVQIIKIMAKRLKMISMQVENLALRDAFGKTASLLIRLLRNEGIQLKDGALLRTTLSRQDMANMVGLSRETFTRALSKLKQDKAIDIDKEQIIITNVEKLESWIY
jgi:CRP/FNR family transcriptional regulator, cyclic AMP receptor protein